MKVLNIVVGPLQSNCYIVYDEDTLEAMIIDPGDEPERIFQTVRENNLRVIYLVCTHAHFDHVGAVATLKEKTGAAIMLNQADLEIYHGARDQAAFWGYEITQPPQPDRFVDEGDTLVVGATVMNILHAPGHSPGGICLYGAGVVFSGDTVFAGSVGRTDFFGGSGAALKDSFRKILSLPPLTKILPGHGEWTTVEKEIETNAFIHEL